MAIAGWLVVAEIVGMLIKWGIETWGQPTDEIKKKLLAQVTLPIPGEADAAKAEADAVLLK
jgi:hypothetical protein